MTNLDWDLERGNLHLFFFCDLFHRQRIGQQGKKENPKFPEKQLDKRQCINGISLAPHAR